MNPWEEILQLLAEEGEEKTPAPTLPVPTSPQRAEKRVLIDHREEEAGEEIRENPISEKAHSPVPEGEGQVKAVPLPKEREGEGVTSWAKRAGAWRLPADLQREQTAEKTEHTKIHSLGKNESPREPDSGLTEEQVLALLDRYLTEEFLGTGGEMLGYD